MRIAVVTDIHGNLAALEAVHRDIRRRGIDLIVNLGDSLSGPLLPRETAEFITVAEQALQRIAKLYEIEADIRGRPPDERRRERLERAAPLLKDLHAWFSQTLTRVSIKSDLAQVIGYTLAHWKALCRYCDDGRIEIDNNAAERALRGVGLGRKNYLFFG
jgi:Icc-related predicted phosphoesterase